MNMNRKPQTWIASALILACTTSLSMAAAAISYTFDSDAQGWYAADAHGSAAWDATHGVGGGGCLKVIITTNDVEVDPRVDVAVDSAQYFSIEMDVMVDATSGTAGGNYGNLQAVMRDAGYSWNSMWFGAVNSSFNTYRHLKFVLPSPYITYAHLQLQQYSGTPSSDIILYFDNITITAVSTPPNPTVLNPFVRETDVTDGLSSWAGGSPAASSTVISWDTNHDAGLGFTPAGSLKMTVDYNTSNSGWQEGDCQMAPFTWDPSRFAYFDFDLYLEAPAGMSTYGGLNIFIINGSYGWVGLGFPGLNASMLGKWTHFSFPLTALGLTSSHGWVFQAGGGMTNTITYYIDNIRVWTPATPPSIKSVARGGGTPGGAQVKMDLTGPANQWQRDAICVPAGQTDYSWYAKGGVTYSFVITNFPDAATHPGFDAHLYIVNQDTIPGTGTGFNQTYGGCDWNAADLVTVQLANGTNGGVDFTFTYKTNQPNANPTNRMATLHASSALGGWYVYFGNDNISVTMSNSSGLTTNFTLPQEVADRFNADISWIQIGAFKNDGAADGHNDGASCTFSRIAMEGGTFPFDDTFGGPGLTANYAWRTSSSSAIHWIPDGLGAWLTWTVPDDGYTATVSGTVTGPYADAGVTYSYIQGDKRTAAVPTANLPGGNAAFFRLQKPITP